MESDYLNVYVTAPNPEEAKKIAASVLENRLAACASLIEGVNSAYWWRGKIEKATEVLIIMKTKRALAEELFKAVRKIHSYSVPEIIAVPITLGDPEYLKWIDESVGNK